MPTDALGRNLHLGQPATIGADGRDFVVGEFQQHAAQGVAAALVVGGEYGAADQLFEQPGRQGVILRLGKIGDGRKLMRVFGRQTKLAPLAADQRALFIGFQTQLIVAALA